MIKGFERETHDLSEYEVLTLVMPIVNGLSNKIGKEQAITSGEIVKKMSERGYKISPPRLRKIIHYIRVNHLVRRLVATSSGYYIEPDDKELQKYIESLEERVLSIAQVRDAMKGQLNTKQHETN